MRSDAAFCVGMQGIAPFMFAVSRFWLVFDAALMVKKDLSTLMFSSTYSTRTRLLGTESETFDTQFIYISDSVIKYSRLKNTADI